MSKSMLFLYTESSLHAGSGRALGTVDLPIQRERSTGYPMIQASGIKGRLRAEMQPPKLQKDEWLAIFGPETEEASEYAGALSFGDARLLLFPVRSLAGVFAWCTSVDILARFIRDVSLTLVKDINLNLPKEKDGRFLSPQGTKVWVSGKRNVISDQNKIVLEEFSFDVETVDISNIANEIVKAFPDGAEYGYWRQIFPQSLCILPEDAFRDFSVYATEVQTHIKLDPNKKTVEGGALWTAESLPEDTLMYVPLLASKPRREAKNLNTETDVLDKIVQSAPQRINFGGDETTGQGFTALKFVGGGV